MRADGLDTQPPRSVPERRSSDMTLGCGAGWRGLLAAIPPSERARDPCPRLIWEVAAGRGRSDTTSVGLSTLRSMGLLDSRVIVMRVRMLGKGPIADGNGRSCGYVLERRGLRFHDSDAQVVLRVAHSTGWTSVGRDRWRFFDGSGMQIGEIDRSNSIFLKDAHKGCLEIGALYESCVVRASTGDEIADIRRLPLKGLLTTYGHPWRLERRGLLDESLRTISLACLGAVFLAHNADVRVG